MPSGMKFRRLSGHYAVYRLSADAAVPDWATRGEFTSITRTADELSVVCPAGSFPPTIDPGPRWICLQLQGPFPFTQTGVLLSFIKPLSENDVPIFALSTYDTDYVLIQEQYIGRAVDLLRAAGHQLVS
jgi:hypothetical protein